MKFEHNPKACGLRHRISSYEELAYETQRKADDGADARHLRGVRLVGLPYEEQDQADNREEEAEDTPSDAARIDRSCLSRSF